MSDERPWEDYANPIGASTAAPAAAPTVAPTATDKPWEAYPSPITPSPATTPTAYKSGIFPVSKDISGKLHFDPSAGITGSLYQATTLPGRVYSGETKVDPSNPAFIGDVWNMAGWANPANPMVRSGDRPIPGMTMAQKDPSLAKPPTSQQLIEAGQRRMDQYENMPIQYNPQAIGALGSQIEQEILKTKGGATLRENSPQLYAFIDALKRHTPESGGPGATVSAGPPNLVAMRQNLTDLFSARGEKPAGVRVALENLDRFIEKPPAGATLARSPAFLETLGPELYATGRADYSAGMRAAGLEDIKRTADLRAGAADRDPANAYRNRIAAHILDAQKTRSYTDAEKAALENVALDTLSGRIKRTVGSMMGGGGGPGAAIPASAISTAAGYMGVPTALAPGVGGAAMAAGAWLRRSAGESTKEALERAIDQQKRRSPLFQSMGRQDLVPAIVANRDAIARYLAQQPATITNIFAPKPVLEYDPNRT